MKDQLIYSFQLTCTTSGPLFVLYHYSSYYFLSKVKYLIPPALVRAVYNPQLCPVLLFHLIFILNSTTTCAVTWKCILPTV